MLLLILLRLGFLPCTYTRTVLTWWILEISKPQAKSHLSPSPSPPTVHVFWNNLSTLLFSCIECEHKLDIHYLGAKIKVYFLKQKDNVHHSATNEKVVSTSFKLNSDFQWNRTSVLELYSNIKALYKISTSSMFCLKFFTIIKNFAIY